MDASSGLTAAETIAVAAASAVSRAILNVIDRQIFGLYRQPVIRTSTINNVLPSLIAIPTACWLIDAQAFIDYVFDPRVLLFAFFVQAIATLFGKAFQVSEVPRVIVFSKLPDLFIPLGLFLTTGVLEGYWFSLATVLACAPVILELRRRRSRLHPVLFVLLGAIVVQASLSPLLVADATDRTFESALLYTAALLVWRTMWSLGTDLIHTASKNGQKKSVTRGRAIAGVLSLRCLFTIATQTTFVYALSAGDPSVAWPVLNATPLVAVVASALILPKERPTTSEVVAVTSIAALAITRGILQ